MINVKNVGPILLKIDKKSYKSIDIYYIGYMTMKDSDFVEINSVNPLCLMINEVDGCIGKISGTLVSAEKNKEALTKCTELPDEI